MNEVLVEQFKKKGRKTIRMADQEWIRLEDVTDEIREQYNLDNL